MQGSGKALVLRTKLSLEKLFLLFVCPFSTVCDTDIGTFLPIKVPIGHFSEKVPIFFLSILNMKKTKNTQNPVYI